MSRPVRYLLAWTAFTVVLIIAVAGFNLVVDPYDIFRVIHRDGFNSVKSQASQRTLVFKRENVGRMHPRALILGNSRAEVGFDPASPAWPADVRPVFNLAIPGTGPVAALTEFKRVQRVEALRLVVVGLDFVDFRVDAPPRTGIAALPPPTNDALQRWKDKFSALLTVAALADSVATLKAQRDPFASSLTESGFNPMRSYVRIARDEGYYALFRQRNQENARNYSRGSKTVFEQSGRPAAEFDAVRQMIALAADRRTAVRFVIYPYHADTLVLFHYAGLWPAFEAWKRELVQIVDGAATGMDIELWDFSGFVEYADEKTPAPGDKASEMRWYWEAGHFKKELGDLMVARIFESSDAPAKWGTRLTSQALDAHLRKQRMERDEYERTHAAAVSELAALLGSGRSQ